MFQETRRTGSIFASVFCKVSLVFLAFYPVSARSLLSTPSFPGPSDFLHVPFMQACAPPWLATLVEAGEACAARFRVRAPCSQLRSRRVFLFCFVVLV